MNIDSYLITPENLEGYLDTFKNAPDKNKDLSNPSYWRGKTAFVTGISGFVGSHLAEKLVDYGSEVFGFVRRTSTSHYPNIEHIIDKVKLVEGNLEDFQSVFSALKSVSPDVVFHLGAQSFVPTSFRAPMETYMTNVIGTSNILEAIRMFDHNIQAIQVACSSEEYGRVDLKDIPIDEDTPLRPMSPYGITKVATETLASAYHRMYGLPTVATRGFNHSGPRRGLQFVTSVVNRQIARCLVKKTNVVRIGKPDSIRDFTHISDMIQGYLLSVEKGRRGEPYNIGHGRGVTIENLARIGAMVHNIDIKLEIDKSRFRPAEVDVLVCDHTKATRELGYRPRFTLTDIIKEGVEHFKKRPYLLDVERH